MARKQQARRQGGSGTPVWAWLLAGLFVGALGYFGYQQYRALTAPAESELALPKPNAGNSDKPTEPPASAEDDGVLSTDYSFYDVLPGTDTPLENATDESAQQDVSAETKPVAGTSTDAPSDAMPTKPVSTPKTPTAEKPDATRYVLQAGAFANAAEADDLKARVALSGETARVEPVQINGKTLYRVRLGPYADGKSADAAIVNLNNQGITVSRIKIK